MSLVRVDPFDDLSAWSSLGSPAVSSVRYYRSGSSLLLDCTGSAKYISLVPGGGTRIIVGRIYYNWETDTSGSASIVQTTGGGTMTLQLRTGFKFRAFAGTASADSAAFPQNEWVYLDFMFRSDSGTHSVDYKLNGIAQAGQTVARAATDFTLFQIGNTATNTYKVYVDEYEERNTAAEYSIGTLHKPILQPYTQLVPQ
jgi:hypothetical protein